VASVDGDPRLFVAVASPRSKASPDDDLTAGDEASRTRPEGDHPGGAADAAEKK
jgi:hypothetical protein